MLVTKDIVAKFIILCQLLLYIWEQYFHIKAHYCATELQHTAGTGFVAKSSLGHKISNDWPPPCMHPLQPAVVTGNNEFNYIPVYTILLMQVPLTLSFGFSMTPTHGIFLRVAKRS